MKNVTVMLGYCRNSINYIAVVKVTHKQGPLIGTIGTVFLLLLLLLLGGRGGDVSLSVQALSLVLSAVILSWKHVV